VQTIFTALNVGLGYYKDTESTVGPDYGYFFFVDMFPTVLMTVAQLYLSRSGTDRRNYTRITISDLLCGVILQDEVQNSL
jgi:hypothetical protein